MEEEPSKGLAMNATIRRATAADAERIQAIYAPIVRDTAISFEAVVPDVAEIRRRIEALEDRYPWLVFEADRDVLGYAYASSHRTREAYRWCVELAVYVDDNHHKRGIGRALYSALFDLLRRQGFVNAYAGITLPNASSLALHQSLGFEPFGTYRRIGFKLGQWHDVAWLHLRLQDPPAPEEPKGMSNLWSDPDLARRLREHAAIVG